MIYAANEKYNLGLDSSHFKMMAPFSGGMYEKDMCGIVTGAIAVLGIVFTEGDSSNSPVLKQAVIEYKTKFQAMLGSTICETLYETQRYEVTGCDPLIVRGGILLEEVIENNIKA